MRRVIRMPRSTLPTSARSGSCLRQRPETSSEQQDDRRRRGTGGGHSPRGGCGDRRIGLVGITTALELEHHGLKVLLIESGRRRFDSATQALGDATIEDASLHAPMSMTTRRVLGGASSVWAGVGVPFDPVDFRDRPFVDGDWPVGVDELLPLYQRACELSLWTGRVRSSGDVASAAEHRARPYRRRRPDLDVRTLVATDRLWEGLSPRLERSRDIHVLTGLTCTRVVLDSNT